MKSVKKHPSVQLVDTGENQASDYRYYCELKSGWVFTRGRAEGATSLFFNTYADFTYACPAPIVVQDVEKVDTLDTLNRQVLCGVEECRRTNVTPDTLWLGELDYRLLVAELHKEALERCGGISPQKIAACFSGDLDGLTFRGLAIRKARDHVSLVRVGISRLRKMQGYKVTVNHCPARIEGDKVVWPRGLGFFDFCECDGGQWSADGLTWRIDGKTINFTPNNTDQENETNKINA